MRGDTEEFVPVADGDPVDLRFPVQGGHVLYVAARIHNLLPCRAELSASLVDPGTGQVATEERRQVDFGLDGGGGGISDLSDPANVANVPVCPDLFDRDFVDAPWNLVVSVKDLEGRVATATRRVIPSCRQAGSYSRAACRCECSAHYVFGKCSVLDGGSTDAG